MVTGPLISAIIIFLNEEKFLQEAIDSVFAQTYTDWELLLVDDGSTDRSREIACLVAKQYPDKVRYLEHPGHQNRGMSASRNLGVRRAHGKYIAYLDGDDIWLPEKLEHQLKILESNPQAAIVHGPLTLWYSWSGNPGDRKRDGLYGVGENGRHPFSNQLVKAPKLLCLFLRFEEYIPSGFLIKKEVFDQQDLYEDDFRDAYSDAVALVKICLHSAAFITDASEYLYRKHTASSTYQSWIMGQEDAEKSFYLNWVKSYFSQKRVRDPRIWFALQRASFPIDYPGLYRLFLRFRGVIHRLKGRSALSSGEG
jgi:glycosyltransferase involved in cell wall biosynthesis